MPRLFARRVLEGVRPQDVVDLVPRLDATDATIATKASTTTVAADFVTRDTAIAARALTTDVTELSEQQAAIDEARWVLDHLAWPDGRPITPAEKSAAADILRADRIARSRRSLNA